MKFLIRILLSIYILFNFSLNLFSQTKYALFVGIGEYPEDSGWNKIHGNDDFKIIAPKLEKLGFQKDHIFSLIDNQATKKNIFASFNDLCQIVHKGDFVYLHFSGHGQQVTDLNGDEPDGWDEAWIPYDASKLYSKGIYEGENHIIDDELHRLLEDLRERIGISGKIIVISDSCHSGSGSRGNPNNNEIIRGTSEKFIIPTIKTSTMSTSQDDVDWLFIGACQPYQSNYEHKSEDGVYYGMLSYILSLDSCDFTSTRYSDFIAYCNRKMMEISIYPQEIDCEGKPNKHDLFIL